MYLDNMQGKKAVGLQAAHFTLHEFFAAAAFKEVCRLRSRITRIAGPDTIECKKFIQEHFRLGLPSCHIVLRRLNLMTEYKERRVRRTMYPRLEPRVFRFRPARTVVDSSASSSESSARSIEPSCSGWSSACVQSMSSSKVTQFGVQRARSSSSWRGFGLRRRRLMTLVERTSVVSLPRRFA